MAGLADTAELDPRRLAPRETKEGQTMVLGLRHSKTPGNGISITW